MILLRINEDNLHKTNSHQNIMAGELIPFSEMTISELEMACFREGIPPSENDGGDEICSITVYMEKRRRRCHLV